MRHRCLRRSSVKTRIARVVRVVRVKTIDAKMAVDPYSNLTNGDAVPDLAVVADTTDEALPRATETPLCKHAADACRLGFVRDGNTVEVEGASGIADVNVFGASDQVLSCCVTHRCVERATDVARQRARTHGGVVESINVIEERQSANCRVDVGNAECARVIIGERETADGSVKRGANVGKERGITHCHVSVAIDVQNERLVTEGVIAGAGIVVTERASTHGCVPAGGILRERAITYGRV